MGVLRRQGTLDHLLAALLKQPLHRLDQAVLILLRTGLYQLVYLDRIPDSAAVNETVKLAKQSVPHFSGLVNAVLRNFIRTREDVSYPDRDTDPVAALSARHSHPGWLVEQWLGQLGILEAELLAEASSLHPPCTVRTNTLLTSRDGLLSLLAAEGVSARPCCISPVGIHLETPGHIPDLPGFQAGLFTVQDEASQIVSLLLDPRPGENVLDACAAPGGKATHLAQLMENRGEVLAADVSQEKLAMVAEAARRMAVTAIRTIPADLLQPGRFGGQTFDRILLDAPCSGLGVIRRNPEAKWRLTPDDITRAAAVQTRMLDTALHLLKPGGVLVYSTCSTATEENEAVVTAVLPRHDECVQEDLRLLYPGFGDVLTAEGMFRAWPHRFGMDGFFAVRIRKTC